MSKKKPAPKPAPPIPHGPGAAPKIPMGRGIPPPPPLRRGGPPPVNEAAIKAMSLEQLFNELTVLSHAMGAGQTRAEMMFQAWQKALGQQAGRQANIDAIRKEIDARTKDK